MTRLYKARFYTGPKMVGIIAEMIREAGFGVIDEGALHVYVNILGDSERDALQKFYDTFSGKHGACWGLMADDVQQLGVVNEQVL